MMPQPDDGNVVIVFDVPFDAAPLPERAAAAFHGEEAPVPPGLIWTSWTENEEAGYACGVYLFADRVSAEAYRERKLARLRGAGVDGVQTVLRAVRRETAMGQDLGQDLPGAALGIPASAA